LFPSRIILTVGTGEAINEIASGNECPSNEERFERLVEAVYVNKKLWYKE
jgi:hypothetical protein